jgi:RNA polymerase sigma factor (sigma-70 family)
MSHQIVVGDIPCEPPGFLPRPGVLAKLDRAGVRASVIHTTTGLQGRGATHLAAAYARAKLAAGWRLVAWVNAADSGSLQAGLAAVAEATGLAERDSGQPLADAGQAVRRLLEADGDRCLLVFDDVADPEVMSPFVPADGTARVLIVSTRHTTPSLTTAVVADVFGADEALSFLAGRTGLDDEARAAEVAAVLGHMPLALALAAPLIKGQRHGYARYLDRLQATSVDVSLAGDDGQLYPHAIARAVLLSLAAIRKSDKSGMCSRIMAIIAVLSAAGVRREFLHVAGRTGVLADGGRRITADLVDQVLDWLSDQALLTVSLDGQTVMMHRLVAQVIRNGLARRGRLGPVCWVAASVLEAHAIAVAGSQDRPATRHIPQQVTALMNHTAELADEADEELFDILLRLRFISLYHLIELGDSAPQAIAIGEPLTADLERQLGPGHPDTLNARNSLAAAYLAADRVADAISLFEQTLAVLLGQLGPGHTDTLTSRNNLASAYQDAGRLAEAIQLYELNLAERERLLDADDPGTLTSRGNLAAAYLAADRVAEAIPLLEQTLASRERVLGSDHPDTQTSRRNLAKAYERVGRTAEAIPLLEQAFAGRQPALRSDGRTTRTIRPVERTSLVRPSQAPADAAARVFPADFRRPPADPAGSALPASFRRPPVDPAGRPFSDGIALAHAKPRDGSRSSLTHDRRVVDLKDDRAMIAAITAKDPAALAMAYDRYAAALYGYCHWMLGNSADAAESLRDTFVLAAVGLSDRPEPAMLRPQLFALARNECRRRIRPGAATRDGIDARAAPADEGQQVSQASRPPDAADDLADATITFSVPRKSPGAIGDSGDATMQFPAAVPSADKTVQFSMVSAPSDVICDSANTTMQFPVVGPLADATMQFRILNEPAETTDGLAGVNDFLGQAELLALIRSLLADMKPREREVVELSFRHDLNDNDLALALGMSQSRANALAARTRGRLEKSFGALRTALAGRQACPVVGELLADWDGQLSEQTRDLVIWHTEQCQTCRNQAQGALRPTVLSGLLPLAPLPPELREEVLSCCSSPAEDAVAYRRRVARRAESTWTAMFSQAIKRMNWGSIRANPGAAIATTAVAIWAAAAVSVLLLTFAGSHAAHVQTIPASASRDTHAQAADSSTNIPTSPVIALTRPSVRRSTSSMRPRILTQPSTYVSYRVQPSPSPEASGSSSRAPSPKPSKSPSAKPSGSSSTSSPSSPSESPSSSPSPTA